ncbi:hypothetical protein M1M87_01150 [Thermodesulfovibrionales bacterium]|nr:hypothetical protein [Dehalococcoidia bacterium]MCL0049998.1 hypothetical protein [Thermodesulfovibrionales bacterium]MCL0058491.1 hypothetical protein [Dehalococcoidia bacterium]
MKIVTTTVGRRGPEDERQNQERLTAAKRALEKATNLDADLIVLPAGFFTTGSAQAREAIAQSLVGTAKQLGLAVIFGVDQEVKSLSRDYNREIRRGVLPFYGYAWSPSQIVIHCWAQRSMNNQDQWLAPGRVCTEMRLLWVGDETVGVLMCGEIFNQRIRQALSNYQPRTKVVVDVAHAGSRFRVFQGMKVLARLGLPSVCSVHAQCEFAIKHCYVPPGTRLSSRSRDAYVYGPPSIELKLWTF